MPTLLSFKEAFSYKPCQRVRHGSAIHRKNTVFNNTLLIDPKYAEEYYSRVSIPFAEGNRSLIFKLSSK